MLLSLVGLLTLSWFIPTNQANKITLIIMQISVFSSAIPQCMDSKNFRATAIVIPAPIAAYYISWSCSLYSLNHQNAIVSSGSRLCSICLLI